MAFVLTLLSGIAQAQTTGADIDTAVGAIPPSPNGLVVGFSHNGTRTYRGYGTINGGVTPDRRTLFAIGSNTKTFTAILLGIANVGGLSLYDYVRTYAPVSIAPTSNRYNIRFVDLADHHAGLPKNASRHLATVSDLWFDYAQTTISCTQGFPDDEHDCGCCDTEYETLLGGVVDQYACDHWLANVTCATHTPTTGASGWLYSNEGFEVLGHLLASILSYPTWAAANADLITAPLGLVDTMPLANFTSSQISRAANGCDPGNPSNPNCQLLDWLPVGNAAGGLFSTATDMVTWLEYNLSGASGSGTKINNLNSARPIVLYPYEVTDDGGDQYLGWSTELVNGHVLIWKGGSNGPFFSWTGFVPATGKAVVLLSNSPSGYALSSIGWNILATVN
jgi:CubicO group peptidase (beta-lactamase class C family)